MDIKRAIRMAISTGKVHLGSKRTNDAIRNGTAQLIIVARNCPDKNLVEVNKFPDNQVYRFNGTNIELGSMCGKPFGVSTLTVIDPGESGILNIWKENV